MTSNAGDRGGSNPDTSGGTTGSMTAGTTGGTTGGSTMMGPPAQTGTLMLSLSSNMDSIRLNESKDYQLMVLPGGGFNGMVTYAIEGLPTGVTATFNPAGGMVSQPSTVTLTIKTAGDATVGAGSLTVKATSGTINSSAALALTVDAELLVSISKGVDIGTNATPNTTAFGADSIPTVFVAPGTKVTFINNDTINHEIHSDGSLGINHEGGPLMANGANTYTQTFNATGTFNFRCHIHPNMLGQIVVK
jgi:plastocyanin